MVMPTDRAAYLHLGPVQVATREQGSSGVSMAGSTARNYYFLPSVRRIARPITSWLRPEHAIERYGSFHLIAEVPPLLVVVGEALGRHHPDQNVPVPPHPALGIRRVRRLGERVECR